jgi:MYXO-CTERM domain-containing protein
MNVMRARMWIAAGLLWGCVSAQALPLDPIDWVGRRTGGEVCCGFNSTQTFRYDAATDLFTYSAVGQQTGIDAQGAITNAGSMQWLGDFGSGFETLATGALRVDEPSTGVLALLGLGLLVALRRKQRLFPALQGR